MGSNEIKVIKIKPEIWDWWLAKFHDSKNCVQITEIDGRILWKYSVHSKYKLTTRYFWTDQKAFTQEIVREETILLYSARTGFTTEQELTWRLVSKTYQLKKPIVQENGEVLAESEKGFNVTISKDGVIFWD